MAHSIYTGSFRELEAQWMNTVCELQRDDPLREINVLVGSNILAAYLKRRLAVNGRAAANIRFHTFLDLALRLSGLAPVPEKPRMPRAGPAALLENLLAEHTPDVYATLSGYHGFRDALLATFRDLRDAGFSAGELHAAVTGTQDQDKDRRRHLLGLADLYRRYRELAGLFRDDDDDFRSAIRNAASVKGSPGFQHLLVYGIYDVTGLQSRLLAALGMSVDMIYFIPQVDERISDFARPFVEWCSSELSVAPVRLPPARPCRSLELLALQGFGLSDEMRRPEGAGADGSIVFVSAPGESRAAVEIVREILRAVQDGTIRGFHEAAVILRQPESDIPVIAEALRLRGIPCFISGGISFAEHPLARAVVALSRLESKAFSREAVLAALELTVAALPEMAALWDVQGWRALTNDPRFLVGLDSWDAGTEALVEKSRVELERAESAEAEKAAGKAGIGFRSVQSCRQRLKNAAALREAWQLLRQASAGWPAALPWRDWAALLDRRIEPLLGSSADWHIVSSIFDDLGSLSILDEAGLVPHERLRSVLFESIASRSYPVGRFQRDGVNLLSTSAARGLRFPLVIVPGLDEGRFPSKLRQDPLLLDAERSSMGALPLKAKRAEEEKLLFDMAARSAERRLVLMTSRLDESSDRERIPSQFFLRAASAARGKPVALRDLSEGGLGGFRSVSLDNPAPGKDEVAVDEGEIRLRMITAEPELANTALAALSRLEPLRLSRPLQYDRARWIRRLTPFDGRITDPELVRWTAQKIGISAGQVSASRLEEYVKCPYFFFLKRVVELQPWEEQGKVDAIDPLERGLIIHSILENFLKDHADVLSHASAESLRRLLEAPALAALEKARPPGIADLLWEIERDSLMTMLTSWLEFEAGRADGDMRVARLELPFGQFSPEEKHPAFRMKAGMHTFEFRGRIDRVDCSRDGRRGRVTDYKTGLLPESMAKAASRTPLMSGERIQLAVYAGALLELEGFNGLEQIEAEYLHLQPKDGLVVACSFSHEELQGALQALPAVLEAVGDGIEGGAFFARTSGKVRPSGHCDYCDYLPVCGKDRIRREERKASDPAARNLLLVLEPL